LAKPDFFQSEIIAHPSSNIIQGGGQKFAGWPQFSTALADLVSKWTIRSMISEIYN